MGEWELAQVKVASPSTPLTSPEVAWFMDALESVNAVADAAPGFPPMAEAHQALRWVPAGRWPTIADAEVRLSWLREHGPTPYAFTFGRPYAAPDNLARVESDADWYCRA